MKTYDELAAENKALTAQLGLIQVEWVKGNFSRKCISISGLRKVMESTPQQCLREVQAQAGLVGYFRGTDDAWRDLTGGPSPEQMTAHRAIEYSNQVRQGGE